MASIAETVMVGLMSLRATERMTLPMAAGPMPEKRAASSAASMQEVPEAESQLKLKMAAYLVGAAATGGIRRIWLCRPGQGKVWDTLLRCAAMGGYPQARTKTTRKA